MADEQEGTEMVSPSADEISNDTQQAPDAATLLAELERTREALKQANHEAASRRKELEKFQEAEQRRKEAEMTELERANAKLAEIQAERDRLIEQGRTARIRHAIEREAGAQNFHDPADAWRFLEEGAVTLDDDGKVTGAADALKALAKARSYLVKSPTPADPDAGKRGTSTTTRPDLQATASKYGIQVYD